MQLNKTKMSNTYPGQLDKDENNDDGSSVAESNDSSERDNVNDADIFGSLLSWGDGEDDLPSMSLPGSMRGSSNNLNGLAADRMSGTDEEVNSKRNFMKSSQVDMMDVMFSFASPGMQDQQRQPTRNAKSNEAQTPSLTPLVFPTMPQQYSSRLNVLSQSAEMATTQKPENNWTSSSMMNMPTIPKSVPQAFHLSQAEQATQPDQYQPPQNSPAVAPLNPSFSALQQHLSTNQFSSLQLPNTHDQIQKREIDNQDTHSLSSLPQLMQHGAILTTGIPGQNTVAVSQQDLWKVYQQHILSQNQEVSLTPALPAASIPQWLQDAAFSKTSMFPAEHEKPQTGSYSSQICQPESNVQQQSTSNSGRTGRARGRFRSKTLLPQVSDLTADQVTSSVTFSSNGDFGSENSKFASSKANAVADSLIEEKIKKSCGGKVSGNHSKATGAPHRRKSTSLAQEATLAMNVAKEEEQKEKRISQQNEQLQQRNAANVMQPQTNFSLVSNDEMSDTSYRKSFESLPMNSLGHSNVNLMCPPPPAMSASLSYLNATWDVMKSNPIVAPMAAATVPSQLETVEKHHRKRVATNTLENCDESDKKRNTTSSLHDVTSDGEFTTDAEKDSSNVPLHESELSEGERNRLHRNRNREHARNTRLRKKAYVETLKNTVDDLRRERDSLVQDQATNASRLLEQKNIRVDVLLGYFALRKQCERRRDLWARVCEENVVCTLPVTPYRSFPANEVQSSKCQRTIQGIDGLIADATSFHVLLDSIIDYNSVFSPRSPFYALHAVSPPPSQQGSLGNVSAPPLLVSSASPKIQVQYTLITEDACPGGSQLMARWTMTTLNAVALGASRELTNSCMLCAKFSSANKIVSLDHMFDVMAFMLQLKPKVSYNGGLLSAPAPTLNTGPIPDPLASTVNGFQVIPNTVQVAQRFTTVPMILTSAERPYTIMQVNSLWEEMTGHKADAVVGKTSAQILQPRWLQVPNLNATYQDPALSFLMMEVRLKRPASATLINVNATGDLFRHVLQVFPLSTDGKITHYLGLTVFKQPLGINWSVIAQNPMIFSQHVTQLGTSLSVTSIGSIRSSSTNQSKPSGLDGVMKINQSDTSAENSVAKVSDGGSF